MLVSNLLSGDPLLEAIADGGPTRISATINQTDPAVAKIQLALLDWDPNALPRFGSDGAYGGETSVAVHRFKRDELLVPEGQIIDDVGPRTVRRLDEIRSVAESQIPPRPPHPIRRDAWNLSAINVCHPILTAYARAVGVLKLNGGPDPRLWWSHHTQVHGMTPDPGDGLRNQCQHFSWFFLPWHRIYLDRFQAICQEIVAADELTPINVRQSWALPYWDYDRSDSNTLPPIFRMSQLGGKPNPLFDEERAPRINNLDNPKVLLATETTARGWFARTQFSAPSPQPSFGGPVTGFHHLNESGAVVAGSLEGTPHGTVHVAVGGATGKMSDFDQAAGDPIFWLHHANIDRLWEVWLASAGLGAGETNRDFLNREFAFAGVGGGAQNIAVSTVVDPSPRPHTYEDLSIPASAGVLPRQEGLVVSEHVSPQRIGAVDQPLVLTNGVAQAVEVAIPDLEVARVSGQGSGRVLLSVEHFTAENPPSTTFGVYIASGPEPEDIWVGNLPLFGLAESMRADGEHGLSFTFDITDTVQSLLATGEWDPASLALRFAPVGEIEDDSVGVGEVEVGSVSILFG